MKLKKGAGGKGVMGGVRAVPHERARLAWLRLRPNVAQGQGQRRLLCRRRHVDNRGRHGKLGAEVGE